MKTINYILVNETACKSSVCDVTYRFVPDLGHCTECFAVPGFLDEPSGKTERKVQGSRERAMLLDELCRLRRHNPNAKILGVSEIDGKDIRPSEAMNQLRRELSSLP